MKTRRRRAVLTIGVMTATLLGSLLLFGCSSTSGSQATSAGSCLEPGYACNAGDICCTGANGCPAGKCASPTPGECRSYSGCATCAAATGCAYCRSTGACLDEFGQQGPDWDSCANLAVDPSSCTASSSSGGATSSSSGSGGTTGSCNCTEYTQSTPVCGSESYFVCGTRQVCADTLADACASNASSSGGTSSSGAASSGGTGVSSGGSSGGTGSSSGGATCPSGYPVNCTTFCCPSGSVCCAGSTCSSTGSCSSGTSSSSGSSGGGGTACTDLNSCVSATSQTAASGTSCTGAELYGTLTNNCGQAAYCRVCPVVNSAVFENGCGASGIQAGQTESGEGAGWWWCEGTEIRYLCSASTDPSSCVQF